MNLCGCCCQYALYVGCFMSSWQSCAGNAAQRVVNMHGVRVVYMYEEGGRAVIGGGGIAIWAFTLMTSVLARKYPVSAPRHVSILCGGSCGRPGILKGQDGWRTTECIAVRGAGAATKKNCFAPVAVSTAGSMAHSTTIWCNCGMQKV